ncbi:MAG: 4'-phosphopantetheinyl transferase superfamily protein [Acidiferrobacterales bacterium]|nr:4'-phosphopantetheinyl transferase superfamily protein [Acidiferrobacterales bacterium]
MLSNSTRKALDQKENTVLFVVDNRYFECLQQLDEFHCLNRDQIDRIASMSTKRAKEYRLSRWLLRYVLDQYLSLPDQASINIKDRENLPPYCPQAEAAGIHFSISHSADLVGVAVSEFQPLGLDIEYRGKLREYLNTAEQFCSKDELNTLRALDPNTEQSAHFYLLWTQKEAYLKSKCLGIGAMELGTIEFKPADQKNTLANATLESASCYHAMCFLYDDYQIALAAQQIRRFNLVEIRCEQGVIQIANKYPGFDLYRFCPNSN